MAVACAGDIELTEEGEALAKASVQGKRTCPGEPCRLRSPWQPRPPAPSASSPHTSDEGGGVPRNTLERHCSAKEARPQLVTLIAWDRSAEAFAYDEATRDVYLEPEDNPLR